MHKHHHGFSLVELSIVLVILGLLVGGILAGQSLIQAASLKSQISQLEAYRTASFAFRDKYLAFPGDLPAAMASRLNFTARAGYCGSGDGNGMIAGTTSGSCVPTIPTTGETAIFWSDLSNAGLIEGRFNTAHGTTPPASNVPASDYGLYFPAAKLNGHHVAIWSGSKGPGNGILWTGINRFTLIKITSIGSAIFGYVDASPAIPVEQAWNMDRKMDDGIPMQGKVNAQGIGYSYAPVWAGISREDDEMAISSGPTSGSCQDNGGVAGAPYQYTLSNGRSPNCYLSFQF